jgi:hypothetical protein
VVETIRKNIAAVERQREATGQPMIVHINHPNFVWSLTAEQVAEVAEAKLIEVYNGHPSVNHLGDETRPGDEAIWDMANTIRLRDMEAEPLLGVATDDSHHYHGGDVSPGRGWVMVRAPELSADAIVLGMERGDFYASSGVTLEKVDFDAEQRRLSIQVSPVDGETHTIELIGSRKAADAPAGQVLDTVAADEAQFVLADDLLFARVRVTSSASHPNPSYENQKKRAWTQPVGWSIGQTSAD